MVTRRARRLPANPLVAVAYLRLSKDDDASVRRGKRRTSQVGLDVQRARIEAWAASEGVTVVAWVVAKGESGAAALDERKGIVEAVAAVQRHGAGLLVVHDRSRLARDVLSALMVERDLQKLGAHVASVDGVGNGDTPNDGLLRTVIDGVNQHYVETIIAKTKAALAEKKARGERTGTIPYGKMLAPDGIHLEPHPEEQQIIGTARGLRAKGMTLQAITEELEVLGMVNRKGKPFSLPAIHALVRP